MNTPKYDAITLGEVMLRMTPPDMERLSRFHSLECSSGGAEYNVAVGLSKLGLKSAFITKIPAHAIGDKVEAQLLSNGVSDEYVIRDADQDARLGLYFAEKGSYPRTPSVVYDRYHSSFSKLSLDEMDESMFDQARLFHFSGIDLALCKESREFALALMKKFKEKGALISFDVNFRGNLWSGEEARQVIEPILKDVDILFCSEDTARLTFHTEGSLRDIQKYFADTYDIDYVFSTKRTVKSPQKHDFTSMIYSRKSDQYFEEQPYLGIEIVDRIGSGDAYVAGALFGLLESGEAKRALEVGNAYSALKNTVPGDLPASNLKEVEQTIANHQNTSGYISEMNR